MVEMLGVLAIMGLLSIVALSGYRLAMTKYRASELLSEANRRATVLSAQFLTSQHADLSGFTKHDFGYGVFNSGEVVLHGNRFDLTISDVTQDVCEEMLEGRGKMVRAFSPETCMFNNVIVLTYDKELSTTNEEIQETQVICGDTQELWNGNCVDKCAENQERDEDGTCKNTDEETPVNSCGQNQYLDANDECQSCPSQITEATSERACLGCFSTSFWSNQDSCLEPCTGSKYHIMSGACNSCTSEASSETTARECGTCGSARKTFTDDGKTYCAIADCSTLSKCSSTGCFQTVTGTCVVCNQEATSQVANAAACGACSAYTPRQVFEVDGVLKCGLKTCPAGKYHNVAGTCANCSSSSANDKTSEAYCSDCSSTSTPRYYRNSKCYACPTTLASASNAESCAQCFNGTYNGSCSCPTDINAATTVYSCTQCFGGTYNSTTKKCVAN